MKKIYIMNIFNYFNRNKCKYIEVSDIRKKIIREKKCKKAFNIDKCFYYDESENYGNLHIDASKNNGFNIGLATIFVLGGFVCSDEINDSMLLELKSQIKVKNNPTEIKSKNIYGSGDDYKKQINNKNLKLILEWIEKNKLFIHFTSHCAGYGISEQIISTIHNTDNTLEKESLQRILFELICKDEKGFSKILERFNYPNVKTESSSDFWKELIKWSDLAKYTNISLPPTSIDNLVKNINIQFVKLFIDCLKTADKKHLRVKDIINDNGLLIENDLLVYYQMPRIKFLYSKHIFDNEDVIKRLTEEYPLSFNFNKVQNYSFVDSKKNDAILICDWIVGILKRTLNFLHRTNEDEMFKFIRGLNDLQKSNLELLGKLIHFSENENPYFISISDQFGLQGKLEWITSFRENEVRAYLKR